MTDCGRREKMPLGSWIYCSDFLRCFDGKGIGSGREGSLDSNSGDRNGLEMTWGGSLLRRTITLPPYTRVIVGALIVRFESSNQRSLKKDDWRNIMKRAGVAANLRRCVGRSIPEEDWTEDFET